MINENAFTWKLKHAPTTWRVRFRDAKIDAAEFNLAVDFIPVFSGIDTGSSVVGDFILGTALWADIDNAELPPIDFIWPGDQYFVDGDSSIVGEAAIGGNNMGIDGGLLRP